MSNYIPAVGSNVSPAGTPMNCNSWGTYEPPNTSATAGFCNGGTVDGELWAPCPSQEACRVERNRRSLADSRSRLPVMQQSNVRIVGQPPRTISVGGLGGAPTSLAQRPAVAQVISPTTGNPYLDTIRANTGDHHSPTYLPAPEESFWRRLFANMFIGMLEAGAYHVSSFLKNVDIFPFRKKDEK